MHGPVEPKPADVPEDQASVSSEAKTHLKLSSSDEVPCPPSSEATPRSCSEPPALVASSSSVDVPGEAVGLAPASSSTVTETSPESGQEEEEAEAVGDYSTTSSEAALSPSLMSEYDAWLHKAGYSRERSVEAQMELNRLLKCVVGSSLLRSKDDCQSLLLRRGREVEELLALFRSGPQRAFYDQFRDWLGMGTSAATALPASSSQPPPQGFMPPAAAAAATGAVQQQPPPLQPRPDAAPSPPLSGRHGLSAPSTLLSLAQGAAEAGLAAASSGQSGAGLSGSTSSSSFSSSGGALPSSSSSSACPSIASLPLPNSGPLPSAPLEPRRTGARRGRPPGSAAVNFLAPDLKNDYQEWLVAKKGLTQLSSTQYCNSIGLVIKDLYEPGRVRREKLAVPFDVPAVRAMLTQRFDEIEALLNNSVKRNAVKYLMEYLDLKLPRPMVPIKTHKPASRDLKLPPHMGLLPPRGVIPPGLASGTLIQPGRPPTVQHAAQHHLFSHPPRGMPPVDAIMGGGPSLFFPGARPPATSLSAALQQQQQQQQVMSQGSAFRPSAALPRFDQTGLPPAAAVDHLALQQLAQQHQQQLAAQQQQQLLQSAFNARAAMGVGGDARLFGDGNRGSTGKASRSAEDDQLALLHHVAKLQRMHSGGGQQQQQEQQQQPPQWPLGSRVDPALEVVGGHMTSLASAMHQQQQQQQQQQVMNRGGPPNSSAQTSTSRLASMMEAQQAAAFQQQQQQRASAMALQGSSANPQQQQQPDWARRGAAGAPQQQVAPEFRNHLDRLTQERLEYQSRLQQLERQNLNMASELTAAKRECHVLNQRLLTSDQLQANAQHQHLSPALAPMAGIDGRVAEAQEAMMRRGLDASSSSSSMWSRAFQQQQAVEEEGRRREQLLGSMHQQQQQQEVAAAGMLKSALLHAAAVAASSATQQQQQQQQQHGASAMPPSSSVADPSGGKSIFGGSNSTYSLAGAGSSSSDHNIASDANLLQSLRRGGSGNLSALGPAGVLTATRASGPGPTGSQLASLLALSSSQRSVGSNGSGTGGSTGGGSVLPSWQV